MAALLLLGSAIGAILQTQEGWELPEDAYPFFSLFVGAFIIAVPTLRSTGTFARSAGAKVLLVMAGLCLAWATLLWLSTLA